MAELPSPSKLNRADLISAGKERFQKLKERRAKDGDNERLGELLVQQEESRRVTDKLRKENVLLSQQIAELELQVAELEDFLAASNRRAAAAEDERTSLMTQVSSAAARAVEAAATIAELTRQVDEYKTNMKQYVEVATIRADVSQGTSQSDILEGILSSGGGAASGASVGGGGGGGGWTDGLADDVTKARAKMLVYQREAEALMEEKRNLMRELEHSKSSYGRFIEEHMMLKDTLQGTIQSLMEERTALEHELSSQHTAMALMSEMKNTEIHRLNGERERLTALLAAPPPQPSPATLHESAAGTSEPSEGERNDKGSSSGGGGGGGGGEGDQLTQWSSTALSQSLKEVDVLRGHNMELETTVTALRSRVAALESELVSVQESINLAVVGVNEASAVGVAGTRAIASNASGGGESGSGRMDGGDGEGATDASLDLVSLNSAGEATVNLSTEETSFLTSATERLELAEARHAVAAAAREIAELKTTLGLRSTRIDQLIDEKAELTSRLVEAERDLAEVGRDLSACQERIVALHTEVRELTEVAESVGKQFETIATLSNTNDDLVARLNAYGRRYGALTEDPVRTLPPSHEMQGGDGPISVIVEGKARRSSAVVTAEDAVEPGGGEPGGAELRGSEGLPLLSPSIPVVLSASKPKTTIEPLGQPSGLVLPPSSQQLQHQHSQRPSSITFWLLSYIIPSIDS